MIAVPIESNEDEKDGLGCPGSVLVSLTSSSGLEVIEDLLKLRKLWAEPGLGDVTLGCSSSVASKAPRLSLWECRLWPVELLCSDFRVSVLMDGLRAAAAEDSNDFQE